MTAGAAERPALVRWLVRCLALALIAAAVTASLESIPRGLLRLQGPFAVLAGTTTGLLLVEPEDVGEALRLLLIPLLGAAGLLALAELLGTPFGRIRFGPHLGGRVAGTVPLGLPFVWLAVLGGCLPAARALMGTPRPGWGDAIRVAFATSVLATLVSFTLDPVARVLGWWHWELPGRFDGVPLTSFLGWWSTSLVLAMAVIALAPRLRLIRIAAPPGPILILLCLMVLLVVVALRSGSLGAATSGSAAVVVLGSALLRARSIWLRPVPASATAVGRTDGTLP